MVEREPVRVDYDSPQPPPHRAGFGRHSPGKFWAGLVVGTSISLIYWPSIWSTIDRGGEHDAAYYGLPVAKVVAALIFIFVPGWASFGVGLLLSIALGFLVFFGTCAVNFKL